MIKLAISVKNRGQEMATFRDDVNIYRTNTIKTGHRFVHMSGPITVSTISANFNIGDNIWHDVKHDSTLAVQNK